MAVIEQRAPVATVVNAASRRSTSDWLFAVRWALALPAAPSPGAALPRARPRSRRHSLNRDRMAVQHHYDAGNEFYALWLDHRMVYSCAYFPTGTEDLDAAQGFAAGRTSVHQALLARPDASRRATLPWSRGDLYTR